MTKAIFFDIDGTLLNEKQEIPVSARLALRLAKQKGNKIIINTGRTLCCIPEEIRALQPDGYICGCGTGVYLDGQTLFYSGLSRQQCERIICGFRENRIAAGLEGQDAVWFDMENPSCKSSKPILGMKALFGESGRFFYRDIPAELSFDKLFALGEPPFNIEVLKEIVGEEMEVIPRENGCAEVVQPGISKATGMDLISRALNIGLEDTYAIGDGNNDIPMLAHCPHAVAMGNYNGDILEYCEFVTTHVNEDGIYNALAHYDLL